MADGFQTARYLVSPDAPSHRGYIIGPPQPLGALRPDQIIAWAYRNWQDYNASCPVEEKRSGFCTLLIVSFPICRISHEEQKKFIALLALYIAKEGFVVAHERKKDGKLDLNFVVPTVVWEDGKLRPRRTRNENERMRIWHAAKKAVEELNTARAAASKPLIPTPTRRRPNGFFRKLAKTANASNITPTATKILDLVQILIPGASESNGVIILPPNKRRTKHKKFPVHVLVAGVEKEREETAQETQGKSAPLVEPSAEQQKHTDVIQPLSKMHSCITPTFPR